MKIFLIVVIIGILSSCTPKSEYLGTWIGSVIILDIEYKIMNNNKFTLSSFASNGIQVGGARGSYSTDDDKITFNYKKSYHFDMSKNKGSWSDSNISKTFLVKKIGISLILSSEELGMDINLTKK